MTKKLTTQQTEEIKALTVNNIPIRKIAKKIGISYNQARTAVNQFSPETEKIKREIAETNAKAVKDTYSETMQIVARNLEKAIRGMSKRLSKPSVIKVLKPEQLALSNGICQDKLRAIKGDATEVIKHTWTPREALDIINGKIKADRAAGKPAPTETSAKVPGHKQEAKCHE